MAPEELFRAAAREGEAAWLAKATAEELFAAAREHFAARRFSRALQLLRTAAHLSGHAGSQNLIGEIYWEGYGVVPANKSEGVWWHTLASDQDYAAGHHALGYAFEHGEGVAKDEDRAVALYALGAEQGEVYSLNDLGVANEKGLGRLNRSASNALPLYIQAASQGEPTAQYNAAMALSWGEGGVATDNKRALFWMQLAADGGHAGAREKLADYTTRCGTSACRRQTMAMVRDFTAQDACKASLFSRANYCGGYGEPTPAPQK